MSKNNGIVPEVDSLSTIKSTFNFNRRARPPPPTEGFGPAERTPLGPGAAKLSRRESKGGLRSIFTRNKTSPETSRPISPAKEVVEQNASLQKTQAAKGKTDMEINISADRVYAKSTTSTSERKTARMSLMPKLPTPRPVPRGSPKQSAKPVAKSPRRTLAAWDPPPLFQAYPQAIKHAQLSSSTISADSILRMSHHRRNSSVREDITQSGIGIDDKQNAAAQKMEKTRSKHERQLSGSLSKAEWAQKIYMLVTSGYLLQYSGEGSFDRLPEKMMQLGKDSVAFASDVIPGKHWVLQISQAMDSDGIPAPDPRSLLSRLTFRGADYRRAATSFLLILDSAEDLESWIITVRREIEALGGKKYVSETGKPKVDEQVMRLKSQPSQRLLVQRDPDRFSNPTTPRTSSYEPQWMQSGDDYPEQILASLTAQYSVGPSTNRLSAATSSASHDSQPYESQTDNSFRLSYVSSGQRTLLTSQASTPACSPTKETFPTLAKSHIAEYIEQAPSRHNGAAISERRRSLQAVQKPVLQTYTSNFHVAPKKSQVRPHSTYGGPGRPMIVQSPSTPNFSVPHSVSKRYALARAPDSAPAAYSTRVKTPPNEQNISMKGNRKSPPTRLKSSQLSPVQDYPSPLKQRPSDGPLQSSSQDVQAIDSRPTVGLPARSRSDSPTDGSILSTGSSIPGRRSSYMPPKSPSFVQNSVISDRRQVSLQAHSDMVAKMPETLYELSKQQTSPDQIPLPASPMLSPMQSDATPNIDVIKVMDPHDNSRFHSGMTKPRRPPSMQVLTNASPNLTSSTVPPPNGTMTTIRLQAAKPTTPSHASLSSLPTQPLSAPHISSALSSPSIQRLQATEAKKNLLNRRSMPHLVKGPPPAPPPSYALPPIPPGGLRSPLALRANRSSVMI